MCDIHPWSPTVEWPEPQVDWSWPTLGYPYFHTVPDTFSWKADPPANEPEVISTPTTMEERLTAVGKLCDEKQKEYGDAVSRAKEIMKVLYPDGVSVDQYGDVLLMVRVIDKLSRIATNAQAFGESPAKDIAGYAALWMREHGE